MLGNINEFEFGCFITFKIFQWTEVVIRHNKYRLKGLDWPYTSGTISILAIIRELIMDKITQEECVKIKEEHQRWNAISFENFLTFSLLNSINFLVLCRVFYFVFLNLSDIYWVISYLRAGTSLINFYKLTNI